MKFSSIVGHIAELCLIADSSSKPVDQIAWSFFKERRYLGARDRFRIRESLFGIQRDWRLVETLVQKYFDAEGTGVIIPDGKERYLPMYVAHARIVAGNPAEEIIKGLEQLWTSFYPSIPLSQYIKWLEEHQEEIKNPPGIIERLGILYSFPDWMVSRLLQQYGDETELLLRALNSTARTTLRVNLYKITREECQLRLLDESVETTPTQYSPVGLITNKRYNRMASPAYKEGLYEFQDEGSQLISLIADPKPGEVVIDACAGGGGKTMHLSEMMKDTGTIIAVDIDEERMKGLQARKERSMIQNIELRILDAMNPAEYDKIADLVLVDAPCSGVGRIRRSPDIKRHLRESLVDAYPARQREILLNNADFVKPGGRLVYATCSLFKSENEDVINSFLAERSDYKLYSPGERLQSLGLIASGDGFIRLLPHQYPTDGFFVAVMKRS